MLHLLLDLRLPMPAWSAAAGDAPGDDALPRPLRVVAPPGEAPAADAACGAAAAVDQLPMLHLLLL